MATVPTSRKRDRLRIPTAALVSPFQLGMAWAGLALALGVLATTLLPIVGIFSAIQLEVALPVVVAWATFLALGSVGVLLATFGRVAAPPRSIVLEAPSLVIMGSAWLVYAVVPLLAGGILAAAPFGACFALACFLRVYAMAVTNKAASRVRAIQEGMD